MPKGVEVDRPEESASSAGDSKKAKEKEKKGKKNSWAAGRNLCRNLSAQISGTELMNMDELLQSCF